MIIENIVTSALTSSLIGPGLLQALGLSPAFTRQRVAESLAALRVTRFAPPKPY